MYIERGLDVATLFMEVAASLFLFLSSSVIVSVNAPSDSMVARCEWCSTMQGFKQSFGRTKSYSFEHSSVLNFSIERILFSLSESERR